MKRILVVIDFQNDFVDGTLGFDRAKALEQKIVSKIDECRASGYEVVFTFDTHAADYLSTLEGRHLPTAHCVRGTSGWNLYGEVAGRMLAADLRFEKPTFGSPELAQYLAAGRYDSVLLIGVVSNICVLANAVLAKTYLPEARVTVDASCTASFDARLHEAALDVMQGLHIQVTNRSELGGMPGADA